jgi:hypothetical protein
MIVHFGPESSYSGHSEGTRSHLRATTPTFAGFTCGWPMAGADVDDLTQMGGSETDRSISRCPSLSRARALSLSPLTPSRFLSPSRSLSPSPSPPSLSRPRALACGHVDGIGKEEECGMMQLSYLACYSATPSAHTPLTNKTCILAPDLARGYEGASEWNEGHGGLEAAPAPPLISVTVSDSGMGLRLRKSPPGEEEASPPQPRTPTRTRPPSGAAAAPAPLTLRTSPLIPPPGRAIVRETALPSPYVLGIWSTLAEAAAQGRLQNTMGLVRNFRLVDQCYSGERLVSCLVLLGLAADRLHALSIISQVSW